MLVFSPVKATYLTEKKHVFTLKESVITSLNMRANQVALCKCRSCRTYLPGAMFCNLLIYLFIYFVFVDEDEIFHNV